MPKSPDIISYYGKNAIGDPNEPHEATVFRFGHLADASQADKNDVLFLVNNRLIFIGNLGDY